MNTELLIDLLSRLVQIQAEIADSTSRAIADANERRSRVDTFSFGGVEFRRDAIFSVSAVDHERTYTVEIGGSGHWFNDVKHPRAEFIRAWKGA